MSDFDAYSSDMGWLKKLRDEELDQVLAGSYDGEDPALDDLAVFARDAQAALSGVPAEATRQAHLAAMTEVAEKLEGAPVAAGTPAVGPSRIRRRKLLLTQRLATLTAKVAVTGLALAVTGGLAAAGALPEPAQNALANAAEKAGFELPRANEGDETTDPNELPEAADGSSAEAVLEVIRNWEGNKGCEFGHAVAEAAGGNPGPCPDEDEGAEENGDGSEDLQKGRPEGTPSSKPEGAGKPEGTPGGQTEAEGTDSIPSG